METLAKLLELADEMGEEQRKREQMVPENFELNIIGTDSWDTTSLDSNLVGNLLNKRSYVVIPAPSNKNQLHFGLNFTEYFSTLVPMEDHSGLM